MKSLGAKALLAVSCALTALSDAAVVEACGGCFHEEPQLDTAPSVVTGHRMALSISPTRTVLWDQVEYAGDPKDFAWVLPVGPGAYIEASHDAWFEALEAMTVSRTISPEVYCDGQSYQASEGDDGGGFGCSSSESSGTGDSFGEGEFVRDYPQDGVTVEHQGTVGPYETVTLKSDDPAALQKWLVSHGYAIPADIQPVIAAYVAQHAEFIALRLQPNVGVRQMTPVRVITPGASPTLPLKMVAAGTGPKVGIVLYVIAEGRYTTQNFPTALVDFANLSWDWDLAQSNYATLRDDALSAGGFLTSFAQVRGLTSQVIAPDGTIVEVDNAGSFGFYDNITDLYFGQAAFDDGVVDECKGVSDVIRHLPGGAVVSGCHRDVECASKAPPGSIGAADIACGEYDDIAAALLGMHPNDVWVTRLEANLPRTSLDKDLTLTPDPSQHDLSSWHEASISIGSPCPDPAPAAKPRGCSVQRLPARNVPLASLAVLALTLAARRARRRKG